LRANGITAAAACHVTQPTLSEAIRHLERELAVPLIYREGQRFGGLTAEGERALDWARRILADQEALEQELAEMRVGLIGDLHFGVILAAMPATPWLTAAFGRSHPLVTLKGSVAQLDRNPARA
jgi:DNA-binding transcriptional LysR family regulator